MAFLSVQCLFTVMYFIAIYCVFRLTRFAIKLKRMNQFIDKFPMDRRHWLKGHSDLFLGSGEKVLSKFLDLADKYPKAYGLYFINFFKSYVVVHHPDTIKVALKGTINKPSTLGMYRYGKRWLGEGLALSSGSKWLRNRRLLTPTFHFEALKQYIDVDNRATDIFLSKLAGMAKNKSYFEIYTMASLLTFDIISQCAFSCDFHTQTKGEGYLYVEASSQLLKLWCKRQFEPWKHFDFVYWKTKDGKDFIKNCDIMHGVATKLIRERRKLIEEHPVKAGMYHDFLNTLLMAKDEDGNGLTDDEIKDEINTFIVAGFETTAAAISWALYYLALYPKHQKKCQAEIDDIMKGRPDENVNWNDLQELSYLTMCLKESMRLSGIPFIERESHEDLVIDGKFVPSGTTIMMNLYSLHHNRAVWEKPLEFDPERFLPEKISKLDTFAYIPFSAGSR